MIREMDRKEIANVVEIIRNSFMTVAEEFGFTRENAPGFTAFAMTEERLIEHLEHAFDEARKQSCTKMNIGIVEENVKLRRWYEANGAEHIGTEKFDFFPFTCGYMQKML